jgi:sterol desaturase/sphingolipid hydroxylase (fatty acid hydroxylase superfamily)
MVAFSEVAELVAWFLLAFMFASLVEYWMHRLMHQYPKLCQFHAEHHRHNEAQGVLGEFIDDLKGGLILMVPLFLYSWGVGITGFCGTFCDGIFAAFAHQLQHENPTGCFWMKMPVHYVRHRYHQWHHHFGLGLDLWDRVFRTYQPVEWFAEAGANRGQDRPWFRVRWQ